MTSHPILFALLLLASAQTMPMHPPGSAGPDHGGASAEKLGTVVFVTSCAPAVQPQFNRAVALMHSFQFSPAIDSFHSILTADPTCTVAYWGIALSSWGNPFAAGLKSPAQLQHGLQAVNLARATPPRTPRERAYVEAVAHLYDDSAAIGQLNRTVAYADAMAAVKASNPSDVEAAIFYALALAAAADPADKTYARQLQSGAILEDLFTRYPDHPGLAHYIIHAYDVPPLASHAVLAANRYAQIAPSTPHALHMPSHTFTRVGDWQASIDANLASAASARAGNQPADELHASDYLVYAYLQQAQDADAERLVESSRRILATYDPAATATGASSPVAAFFAAAAIPARYALERRQWAEAVALQPHTSPYPFADAMTWFARGLGAAHTGNIPVATAAVTALEQARDHLRAGNETYWSMQVEIQRLEVAAWLAYAQGKPEDAMTAMTQAATLEDQTEKNAVTPGPLAPARELLGELLLLRKQPAAALKQFEAALAREPNRFRSMYGAAESAERAGNQSAAQHYFTMLLHVAAPATKPLRPELLEAQSMTSASPEKRSASNP